MTVHGAVASVDPSGRSSTARRCCSNWLVTAPSCVQWPLLCGRMASSLMRTRSSVVSNSSTASMPVTPRPSATATPIAAAARSSRSPARGAGAITSAHTPSRCVVATRGYARTSPDGRRATCCASSRVKSTSSSTRSGPPWASSARAANQSSASVAAETTRTPLPSYPPRGVFTTARPPWASRKSWSCAASETAAQSGCGIPSSAMRARMTSLSCATASGAGPGWTATPASTSAARTSCGTCSWSNVSTSTSRAKRSTVSASR